jgi:hypothetical protein
MSIIRTFQRASQPQEAVTINWQNPISNGLVFAFEASQGHRDIAKISPALVDPIGAGVAANGASRYGINYTFSGSQANRACSFGLNTSLQGATQASWDILIYFNNASPTAHFFSQWDFNQWWLFQVTSGSLTWVAADDQAGNRTRFDMSNAFPTAGWYHVTASWLGGANRLLVINGVDVSSLTGITQSAATNIDNRANASDYLQIGMVNGGNALAGAVAYARIWKRSLSINQMMALHRQPYQLYKPFSRTIASIVSITAITRPSSDIAANGWSSTGATMWGVINETTASDVDYIYSPDGTTSTTLCLSPTLNAGTYLISVRARRSSSGGQLRLNFGAAGVSAWQNLTTSFAQFDIPITLSSSASSVIIEIQ